MIPKLIHFIFGFSKDENKLAKFGLHHYLAIKSAYFHHPGYKIILWVGREPVDNVFYSCAKKYIEVVKIDPPEQAFGIKLNHYAHQADYFRLLVLRDHGGIYLDLDTLTLKNFESLNCTETVMGTELNPVTQKIQGLCNATIVARQGANFINRWIDSFQFFNSSGRDINWELHAVKIPLILARQVAWDIKIVPTDFFFKFKWSQTDYSDLFARNVSVDNCYSIHLWESHIIEFLSNMLVSDIVDGNSTYATHSKIVIDKDIADFC